MSGGNGITKIMANGSELLAGEIDVLEAQLGRALGLLVRLERIASASGLCSPVDQAAVREARALLVELGVVKRVGEELRAPVSPSWAANPPPWECDGVRCAGSHRGSPCQYCGAVDGNSGL